MTPQLPLPCTDAPADVVPPEPELSELVSREDELLLLYKPLQGSVVTIGGSTRAHPRSLHSVLV